MYIWRCAYTDYVYHYSLIRFFPILHSKSCCTKVSSLSNICGHVYIFDVALKHRPMESPLTGGEYVDSQKERDIEERKEEKVGCLYMCVDSV